MKKELLLALLRQRSMLKTADGGCVFFDEIGELPLSLQGNAEVLTDAGLLSCRSTKSSGECSVISATNRDLAAMVREGNFGGSVSPPARGHIHVPRCGA